MIQVGYTIWVFVVIIDISSFGDVLVNSDLDSHLKQYKHVKVPDIL